jgi:hypothetical protein
VSFTFLERRDFCSPLPVAFEVELPVAGVAGGPFSTTPFSLLIFCFLRAGFVDSPETALSSWAGGEEGLCSCLSPAWAVSAVDGG